MYIYIDTYIDIDRCRYRYIFQCPSISFEFHQLCASRRSRYISGTVIITKQNRFWFLRLKAVIENQWH